LFFHHKSINLGEIKYKINLSKSSRVPRVEQSNNNILNDDVYLKNQKQKDRNYRQFRKGGFCLCLQFKLNKI